MVWDFKIYNDWNEIWGKDFQQRWNDLLAISPTSHVFFHPMVARVWVDTYQPIRRMNPLFVWGTKDGNEVFMPLVLWHRNWKNAFLRVIVPVGYSDYDYHNPLFQNSVCEEELKAFWEELLLELKKIEADEILLDGISDSCALWSEEWRQEEICPTLDISSMNGEADLMAFFDTKLRGDIRRQIRRLSDMASLEFRQYACGKDIPSDVFNSFMAAHSKKWPKAYKAPGFHKNLIEKCSLSGPVHFSTLNVGNTVVAWHLGFDFNGVYYYYMPAGNPDYLKFSPVKVHLYYLICHAIEKGDFQYDHLRGDETYKSGWANGSQYVNTLKISSTSTSSAVKRLLLCLRELI